LNDLIIYYSNNDLCNYSFLTLNFNYAQRVNYKYFLVHDPSYLVVIKNNNIPVQFKIEMG